MKRRDIERRLQRAGRRDAPEPETVFVEQLGARLRDGGGTVHSLARARVRRARWPVAALAAASAAVIVAIAISGSGVRLTDVADAVVRLPDGTEVAARDGQKLPDGAVIRTGAQGRAALGNETLGPQSEAVVRDGRLVTPTPAARTPIPATAAPVVRPVEKTPLPTKPPTPAPTAQPTPAAMRISCVAKDRAVVCEWSPIDGVAYRLARSGTPVYRGAETRFADLKVEPSTTYGYIVEALRGDQIVGRGATRVTTAAPTRQ